MGDALVHELPESDTVLLFDVLHYLRLEEQRILLEKVARCLTARGRLLLRELDQRAGWASHVGRLFERIATAIGYNRAAQLAFRPIDELLEDLRALDFECTVQSAKRSLGSRANVFIVATRSRVD